MDDEGITLDDGAGGRIELKSGKLTITAPAGIESAAPTLAHTGLDGASASASITADIQINGALTSTGDQVAGNISQINHVHGGVETGGGNTGAPQ